MEIPLGGVHGDRSLSSSSGSSRCTKTGFNAVVGTSSTNVNVPAGKYLCLSIAWNSGGPVALRYGNNSVERTNFTTPQVIFVPEFGPALLGLALAIPFATKFWTGRRRDIKEAP